MLYLLILDVDFSNGLFKLLLQSRGSTRDGTGVHDSIVNQLLTKVSSESET